MDEEDLRGDGLRRWLPPDPEWQVQATWCKWVLSGLWYVFVIVAVIGALIAIAIALRHAVAGAAPPPGADPAMEPFFQGLQRPDNGGSCCGQFQDCREVDSRAPAVSPSHHWEALIDDKAFPNQSHVPNEWIVIPDWMVNDAPTTLPRPAKAIACFLGSITVYSRHTMLPAGGHLICFKTPIPWT